MLEGLRKTPGAYGAVGVFRGGDELVLARVRRNRHGSVEVLMCEKLAATDTDGLRRLSREGGLKGARGVGVIPPSAYSVLHVDAPEVHPDELNAALRWQIRDMVDFPMDEAIIDAFEQPAGTRGQAAQGVNVVVTRREELQHHVDLMEAAGLRIEAIDIAELALRNLAELLPPEPHGMALIHLSRDQGLLTFFRDNVLYLSRTLPRGLAHLEQPEASPAPGAASDGGVEEFLTLELQRSIDYYESHFGMPRLARAVLLPRTPATVELAGFLAEQTGIDAAALDPDAHLVWPRAGDSDIPTECYLAIGAALRGLGGHG